MIENFKFSSLNSWDFAFEFWVWSPCKRCEAQNSIQIPNSNFKPSFQIWRWLWSILFYIRYGHEVHDLWLSSTNKFSQIFRLLLGFADYCPS